MTSPVLKAVSVRAGLPEVGWDELEFVLRVVAHGYARWPQRGPEPGRRVSGAVARLRRMRPRYYFDEACTQGRCAHPQSCPVRVARG